MIEFLGQYWWVIVGNLIWPTFWYAMSHTFAKKAELDSAITRIANVETSVAHLPTARDLADLQLEVRGLQGSITAVAQNITTITKTTDTLLEIELKREKGVNQ